MMWSEIDSLLNKETNKERKDASADEECVRMIELTKNMRVRVRL